MEGVHKRGGGPVTMTSALWADASASPCTSAPPIEQISQRASPGQERFEPPRTSARPPEGRDPSRIATKMYGLMSASPTLAAAYEDAQKTAKTKGNDGWEHAVGTCGSDYPYSASGRAGPFSLSPRPSRRA